MVARRNSSTAAATGLLSLVVVSALICGGQATHGSHSSPFGHWLGTYWGHCIQYAYYDSSSSSYSCSQYPVSYPYYVVIGKYQDDSSHSWQYKFSWWNDKTEITHDSETYGVDAEEYKYLPLFYDYYKYNSYCVHYETDDGHQAYFTASVSKQWGTYVYEEKGYFYLSPDGDILSLCPKSKNFGLFCDEHKGYYSYICTAYRVSKSFD